MYTIKGCPWIEGILYLKEISLGPKVYCNIAFKPLNYGHAPFATNKFNFPSGICLGGDLLYACIHLYTHACKHACVHACMMYTYT